jgi:hypothetical protein
MDGLGGEGVCVGAQPPPPLLGPPSQSPHPTLPSCLLFCCQAKMQSFVCNHMLSSLLPNLKEKFSSQSYVIMFGLKLKCEFFMQPYAFVSATKLKCKILFTTIHSHVSCQAKKVKFRMQPNALMSGSKLKCKILLKILDSYMRCQT